MFIHLNYIYTGIIKNKCVVSLSVFTMLIEL